MTKPTFLFLSSLCCCEKRLLRVAVALMALTMPFAATAQLQIVSGLEGAQGSGVGPGGQLYVTERVPGRISRVDRQTGELTPIHEGGNGGLPLPASAVPIGGVVDVAFIGQTAYALVALVNEFGGDGADGIYRIDGPHSATLIADLGAYSAANLPDTGGEWDFFLNNGVQFALETYRGGFLVTDGHHNRVLHVTRGGEISVFKTFGNIVPTGLETLGKTVFVAQAGPVPHEPENGKIVAVWPNQPIVVEVASGAPLLVDVERGRGVSLFGLAQGEFPAPEACPPPEEYCPAGTPATLGTGLLVKVNRHGGFDIVEDQLDQPTSLEIIGNTAYVVTLTGEVWKFFNIMRPPFGRHGHD